MKICIITDDLIHHVPNKYRGEYCCRNIEYDFQAVAAAHVLLKMARHRR